MQILNIYSQIELAVLLYAPARLGHATRLERVGRLRHLIKGVAHQQTIL